MVPFARGVRSYLLLAYVGEGPLPVCDRMNWPWSRWKNPDIASPYPNSAWLEVTCGLTRGGFPQCPLLTRLLMSWAEVDGLCVSSNQPSAFGTCVAWGIKYRSLSLRFVAQKEELEGKYQKQVDDMFFFSYQCCMKKHGIT